MALGPSERTSVWFVKLVIVQFGQISLHSGGPVESIQVLKMAHISCEHVAVLAIPALVLQALPTSEGMAMRYITVAHDLMYPLHAYFSRNTEKCLYSFPLYFMLQQINTF